MSNNPQTLAAVGEEIGCKKCATSTSAITVVSAATIATDDAAAVTISFQTLAVGVKQYGMQRTLNHAHNPLLTQNKFMQEA